MNTFTYKQRGYSLVEVLVAISILLLALVGPMTIASKALQSAQYAREQNTSFFLAQEGIEAIIAIRNQAGLAHIASPSVLADLWLTTAPVNACRLATNGCGFHFDDSTLTDDYQACDADGCPLYFNAAANRARYSHTASGGTPTKYTRAVFVEPITNGARVISKVRWQPSGTLPEKVVTLETYLYNIYDTN